MCCPSCFRSANHDFRPIESLLRTLRGEPGNCLACAWAEVKKRYEGALYKFAYRHIGHSQTAEDIVADTFQVAFCRIHKLKDPLRFTGWLFGIAWNVASKSRQLKARDRAISIDDAVGESLMTPYGNPEAVAIAAEVSYDVTEAMAQLPQSDQETLGAFYFEDLSVAEMAIHFDAPEGTIKSRLHKARGRLRELLSADA